MVHEKKAFWGTSCARDLKAHRAGQDFSFTDFHVGYVAEVSEETSGYVRVFKNHFTKVRESKCHRKRVLKLDWEDGPHDMKRQVQAV
jgi:hypothetical protein